MVFLFFITLLGFAQAAAGPPQEIEKLREFNRMKCERALSQAILAAGLSREEWKQIREKINDLEEVKRFVKRWSPMTRFMLEQNQPEISPDAVAIEIYLPIRLGVASRKHLLRPPMGTQTLDREIVARLVGYHKSRFYEGAMHLEAQSYHSGRSPTSPLARELQERLEVFLPAQYRRSGYTEAEIRKAIEIENSLDPRRRIVVAYSKPSSDEPLLFVRMYDGSLSHSLAQPLHPSHSSRLDWLEHPDEAQRLLPLERSYPSIRISDRFKVEIGRLAKDPSVDSALPGMRFLASQLAHIHRSGEGQVNPELNVYLTAHPAQARLYQRYGFALAQEIEQPPASADELVFVMSGQEFFDRFGAPTDSPFTQMPWRRSPRAE